MESRFSYTLIGIFVIVLGSALVGIAFWLYAGGRVEQRHHEYHAYFDESVSGLNINAPVKFRGVEVGRVTDMGLAPDGSGRVQLLLRIADNAPISQDTYATLRMQGLTGLAQVELSGGTPQSPPLRARAGEPLPVIAVRPSLMTRLDTALTTVLTNLNQTAERVNDFMDEDMRRSLKRTLVNVENATRVLAEQAPHMEKALKSAAEAGGEVAAVASRLKQTATSLDKMAEDVRRAAGATGNTMERAGGGLDQLGGQTLPEINALISELRDMALSLKRVSAELERDPSSLVYGAAPPKPGPGE